MHIDKLLNSVKQQAKSNINNITLSAQDFNATGSIQLDHTGGHAATPITARNTHVIRSVAQCAIDLGEMTWRWVTGKIRRSRHQGNIDSPENKLKKRLLHHPNGQATSDVGH